MKKFLALVLAVLMIASTVVTVAAFDDVAADDKYADAINDLQEYGVVAGKSETEFAPDELVTRWQMALFMARAVSGETDDANWEEGAALFTDCTQYLGAIQYCFAKGIIKGVTATEFAPNANITLRDGVIMAIRALGYEKEDEYVEETAKKYNVTGASYWVPYYQKADELGMLDNLTTVAVTKDLTRAETAQLIYNMLNTKVYNYDANGYKYTLADVVFGGKQIVDVDNVTGAWISETPLQSVDADTIGDDEEIVVLTVNDEDTDATVEVPFADLEKAGVDVENIEDYFGAYIELINCRVDNTGRDEDQGVNYIYKEYEYLAGLNTDNKLVTTNADVSYHKNEDRIRIGSKTHYLDSDEKVRNYVALYNATDAEDGWELIDGDADEINAAIEGKLYDITFIDTDLDGYYEVGLVNFYNIAEYSAPRSTGKETCGIMKDADAEKAEYSEKLSSGDIFVYTYDPFMNTVDVKAVVEAYEGEITGYSEKTAKNSKGVDETTAKIEIDGETYEVSYTSTTDKVVDIFEDARDLDDFIDDDTIMPNTDLAKVTVAGLAYAASNNVGETVEYYLFNDTLLAFGQVAEAAADNYLVVEEFTDFELYDHVVLDAIVDGAEESIKVKKIYDKSTGVKKVWANVEELGYGKLANKLDDIFGMYSYTVDADGYYVLTKYTPTLKLSDYVATVGAGTDNVINFKDWEATPKSGARGDYIRVNSSTLIYLVNQDEQEVEIIKPSKYFSIDVASENDVTFIIDRIGYGDTSKYHHSAGSAGVKYGVASMLYIVTDGEYVDYSDYKFVYVDSTLSSIAIGDADQFALETGDEETTYYQYAAEDGEAYLVSNFKDVDELYVSKDYRSNLVNNKITAGVYLLNSDNIVVDHVVKGDLGAGGHELSYGNVKLPFYVKSVKSTDIDLYGYKSIRVPSIYDGMNNTTNVQTLTFRFYETADGETYTVDKSNDKLIDYLNTYFYDEVNDKPEAVSVVVVPNTYSGFSNNVSFANNTLKGIVLEGVNVD